MKTNTLEMFSKKKNKMSKGIKEQTTEAAKITTSKVHEIRYYCNLKTLFKNRITNSGFR